MAEKRYVTISREMVDTGIKYFSLADYLVFAGMLGLCALTGVYHGFRGSKKGSAAQLLTGRGKLSTVPVALSLLASFLSSITLMGQPSEVYLYGPQMWLFGPACFLIIPIVGYIMVPFFRDNNYFSAYQYFGDRFGRKIQFAASLLFTFQMVFYLALVLYAPALAVNQVTGLSTMLVVTVMYVVCIFYTTVGGMKAVVWTDTFQVIILFGAMVAVLIKGTLEVGGIQAVWQRNAENLRTDLLSWDWDLTQRYTVWSTFIGGSLLFISAYGGNQLQIQRYLTVSSVEAARKMLWINAIGWSIVVFLTTCTGLVIFANYVGCDPLQMQRIGKPDQIFPLFVMDMLSSFPGFPGIFMCGIFSAGLSTVSTGMNSLAAIWYTELDGTRWRRELEDQESSRLVKLLALGFGVLSYLLVYIVPYLGGLVELGISLTSICAGSLFSLFLLGIFFPKVNAFGAGSGLLAGIAVMVWISLGSIMSAGAGLRVKQAPLPLSTDLCIAATNTTFDFDVFDQGVEEQKLASPIYRISFLWYSAITMAITIIVGLAASAASPEESEKQKQVSEPTTNTTSLLKNKDSSHI